MKKRDWIWVAIRIFGIYLLVLAVIALPKIVGASMVLWMATGRYGFFDLESMSDARKLLFDTGLKDLCVSLTTFVLFTAIGIYMVRGGGWLFRLICPPDPEGLAGNNESVDLAPPRQNAA